jgi:hypothetical protein
MFRSPFVAVKVKKCSCRNTVENTRTELLLGFTAAWGYYFNFPLISYMANNIFIYQQFINVSPNICQLFAIIVHLTHQLA